MFTEDVPDNPMKKYQWEISPVYCNQGKIIRKMFGKENYK
jgi:hypothetical protein